MPISTAAHSSFSLDTSQGERALETGCPAISDGDKAAARAD